jgi:hypothetical protein
MGFVFNPFFAFGFFIVLIRGIRGSVLCSDQLFLLHNLFDLAADGFRNAFAILRVALVEVVDLKVLDAHFNRPRLAAMFPQRRSCASGVIRRKRLPGCV